MNDLEKTPERYLSQRLSQVGEAVRALGQFDIQAAADKQRFDIQASLEKQQATANNYLTSTELEKLTQEEEMKKVSSGVASLAVEDVANNAEAARRIVAGIHQDIESAPSTSVLTEFGNAN